MPPLSLPFSIASLTETFTILMNTPMVPPPEKSPGDTEVPLTEMPPRRHAGAARSHFDSGSTYSESADTSARSSFDVAHDVAIFQIEEATEHRAPPNSRTPSATRTTLSPVTTPPCASPALLASKFSKLAAVSNSVEPNNLYEALSNPSDGSDL